MNKKGIDSSNLKISVSPKQDFYEYACGGWIEKNPLTPEYSSFGTFDVLREKAREQLKELIVNMDEDPQSKIKGTNAQKISDLYKMGMDEKRLEEEGSAPIMPTIEKIKSHKPEQFTELMAWLHSGLDSSFFSTGVGPDPSDSNINIMHIAEPGLGLGDRDYYLEKNETNDRIMKAYEEYVKTLMRLTGHDEESSERIWQNVIEIETILAEHKMTREQRRDPMLRYNMYSIDKLESDFNNIAWKDYFKLLGLEVSGANVASVEFMKFLNDYLPTLEWQKIEDYLVYSIVSNSSGLMNEAFIDANFEMFGKVMSGQEEKKPRWKRAMALPNSMFGEAVGELYVAKYFPKEYKDYMVTLVENLRKSLAKHIDNLTWMSDETKAKAKEKLNAMSVKIGYPDKWKDYSELEIDPKKSYLDNVQAASYWYTMDNYKKYNQPVDKTEWHMTPQTVNAYYSPITNEICFPAGILQPPYFDAEALDALNYGAIGVVIGHEMTHGFDDQGRQFDKNGNLFNWWLPEDAQRFNKLADVLTEQFNKIEIAPGVYANGKFTLGENIADQGGISIALTAFEDFAKENNLKLDKETFKDFFLAYAQVWASSIREEEKLARTKSDPHSLAMNRVNVTLKNIDKFMETFDIKDGDKMYLAPEERVIIW